MTVAFYILPHNDALLRDKSAAHLRSGEYCPTIKTNDVGFGVRLNSVVVMNSESEADASQRFLDWVKEAKWAAVDTLLDMRANPYDVHTVATCVAAHLQDWSRSYGIVQRIQSLRLSQHEVYIDVYSPVQFRFLDERNPEEVIVSLYTPVRMRDRSGNVGTTSFLSLAPALAKTDASIYVKSGDDVGTWGDYKPPIVEWFIDDSAGGRMRIFDRPGTVSFAYPNGERIVVDLPGDDVIIGIDAEEAFRGTDTLYLNAWEWSTSLLERSMIYAPNREKPAISLYDDIVDWMHRRAGFRGGEFDESLEALRRALIDLLDIEADMACDEVISGGECLFDTLDDLLYNGFDTLTVLRKTERGMLLFATDSDMRSDRRKMYFVLDRN